LPGHWWWVELEKNGSPTQKEHFIIMMRKWPLAFLFAALRAMGSISTVARTGEVGAVDGTLAGRARNAAPVGAASKDMSWGAVKDGKTDKVGIPRLVFFLPARYFVAYRQVPDIQALNSHCYCYSRCELGI